MKIKLCPHCNCEINEPLIIVNKPKNCVCSADGWINNAIPKICKEYKNSRGHDDYCETCEHEKRCHKK